MALLLWLPACAPAPAVHTEAEVASVLESFYGAIKRGDATAAMSVIAPDAMFVESGTLETRAEYEKNHLPLDIDFERQITGKRGPLRVTFAGDTAWIIATTEYRRQDRGRFRSLRQLTTHGADERRGRLEDSLDPLVLAAAAAVSQGPPKGGPYVWSVAIRIEI